MYSIQTADILIVFVSIGFDYQGVSVETYDYVETSTKRIPLQTQCIVLLRYPYPDRIIDDTLTTLENNRQLLISHGCYVKLVLTKSNACSHWTAGLRHHSFCLLQDLLVFTKSLADLNIESMVLWLLFLH